MSRDNTYQPLNYRKRKVNGGGDLWQIDGQLDIGQTGVLSFYDEEYTGDQLRGVARQTTALQTITNLSTGSTVLSDAGGSSPPILNSLANAIMLSCTGTMTNGSARLFSCKAGQHLFIAFTMEGGGSAGSIIITASGNASGLSGVRVRSSTGSDLSSISMRQSAASQPWLHLIGIDDGLWAIAGSDGTVTERYA